MFVLIAAARAGSCRGRWQRAASSLRMQAFGESDPVERGEHRLLFLFLVGDLALEGLDLVFDLGQALFGVHGSCWVIGTRVWPERGAGARARTRARTKSGGEGETRDSVHFRPM